MRRFLLLAGLAFLLVLRAGSATFAQDIAFDTTSPMVSSLGNLGVTGASARTNFLNTTIGDAQRIQPNGLNNFNVIDVGLGDFNADGIMDLVAVSADDSDGDGIADQGNLTLFFGSGDGTFGFPKTYLLAALPAGLTVDDIELDGMADVGIAEQGYVEVFTGFFLTTGKFRPDLDLNRIGNPDLSSTGQALRTGFGNQVVALAFGRLDGDLVSDIAVAEDSAASGMVEVFYTSTHGGVYDVSGFADYNFTTNGMIGIFAGSPTIAPRAITIQQSNAPVSGQTGVDGDLDIIVATVAGLEIYENSFPIFDFVTTLTTGNGPVAVLALDVSLDGRVDLISVNRGSGTISVFRASSVGYNPPIETVAGGNPISVAPMNFNNDGRTDLVVVNGPGFNSGSLGSITILVGTGSGLFAPGQTFGELTGLTILNPNAVVAGRLDFNSSKDDIVVADGNAAGSTGGVLALSSNLNYNPNFLQVISTASQALDLDGSGGRNDLVIIEQNFGLLFVVQNINPDFIFQVQVFVVRDLFTQALLLPTAATSFRDALTGLNDLAITLTGTPFADTTTGQLVIAVNNGGSFDGQDFRQYVISSGPTNILAGDLNHDGFDDLIYLDYNSNFVAVVMNDGQNQFLDISYRETGGFVPVSAALADVNDDDNLDLVVVNQGNGPTEFNRSLISVMIGQGDGRLVASGSLLQVPSYAMSIVGGLADLEDLGQQRIVDFNNDGFPDLAVICTRGALVGTLAPSVVLLLNRPDSPGNFNVQPPIALFDDTPIGTTSGNRNFQLEDLFGGPGIVVGRGGQDGFGAGRGGGNFIVGVADFNADGSPDLVVTGTRLLLVNNRLTNFRASLYLLGNETSGTIRVARPLRNNEYGGLDSSLSGAETFVSCAVGNFATITNNAPDVLHISVNGRLWVDANATSILNHAPIVSIPRDSLNAPFPGGGRKEIITAGESNVIFVQGLDQDGDRLGFQLVPTPQGEQPPSFVTLQDNGDNTAQIIINSGDINEGPGDAIFRIGVEAIDGISQSGPGGRLPLTGRDYFTLIVHPNQPPVIGAINNQRVAVNAVNTISLSINDPEGQSVTTQVSCDRGNFISINGPILTIAPQAGDEGTSSCQVTVSDQFGLSNTSAFIVTVAANLPPPQIAPIPDQIIRAGEARTINISASDQAGQQGLQFSIISAPGFVSLIDNGQGNGQLRLSPRNFDSQRSRVELAVRTSDGRSSQLGFDVRVQNLEITGASYSQHQFSISGIGFADPADTPITVTINNQDLTARIINRSANAIILKGGPARLKLRRGPNQVIVTVGGLASNAYIYTFKQ